MMNKEITNGVGKDVGGTADGFKKTSHTYDEALDLCGNGFYNISLLATMSLSLFAMCVDMFSFSVVVSLASCDLQLDLTQKSILLSTPFAGPILMAYAWGYISDMKGRKFSMMIGLTGGFVMSSLCAFAPNWIVLAAFKFIGTCFSSCAQSGTYTLVGESCCNRVKGTYMVVMASFSTICTGVYFSLGYFIGNLSFAYDLGYITFVPWRLLVIILALPLGFSSIGLMFFYESPKFLINDGLEDKALEVLRSISRRNGGLKADYPVKGLVLDEDGNVKNKEAPLLRSLWEQLTPLLKPPLLLWTVLLYYLTFVVYITAGSLFIWMPFFANAITSGGNSSTDQIQGLCGTLTHMNSLPNEDVSCATIDLTMVYATIISSSCYCSLNTVMSRLASRKKVLTFTIFLVSLLSAVVIVTVPHRVSGFFYFGVLLTTLEMGLIATYFVDLFPTSFRGMASCLGVKVARISNVVGINIIGPSMLSNCSVTFYGIIALLASGILVTLLLPPDRPNKVL